jgi:hypothetical protein
MLLVLARQSYFNRQGGAFGGVANYFSLEVT